MARAGTLPLQMNSYDEVLEAIRVQFPERYVRRANGTLRLRAARRRLCSQALVARLVRAGLDIEEQGRLPTAAAFVEAVAGLSPQAARAAGVAMPRPPSRVKCGRIAAALGIDLPVADAVADALRAAGLDRRGARYLHLDCGPGQAVRGLQLALPGNEWLGLDRRPAAIDWASAHVDGAGFLHQPDLPPIDRPDHSFDGVIAIEMFGETRSPETMRAWLAEIGRLVRPGGFAVLAVHGYERLVQSASSRKASIADLAVACRSLDATGRAALTVNGRPLSLYGPMALDAASFGVDWSVGAPLVGEGPRGLDLYLARRREPAGRSDGQGMASIEIAGPVEAARLVQADTGYGLKRVERVAKAGSIVRRPPVLVDDRAVTPDLRRKLAEYHAQRRTLFPALHLMRFSDALLAGEGSVVLASGRRHWLLADSAREFLNAGAVPKGMSAGADAGTFTLPGRVHRTLDASCLLLQRPWSENFGHWLVDQAAMLGWLVETGALPTRHVIVTKTDTLALRQVMRQTIDAILPNAIVHEHDVDEVWRCRDLAWMMPVHVPPLFKLPAALDTLRAQLVPRAARGVRAKTRPARRLHILRARARSRRLINEAEIVEIGARYGFETIAPEAYSMREQARLFAEADAVVGVKGAALTNIVFAPPSCRVIVLSPADFIDPFYWDIASARRAPYAELFGDLTTRRRATSYNDFTVDPVRFEAALRQMLGE